MIRTLILLVCITLAACASAPQYVPRPAQPAALFVDPICWQACQQSPAWLLAPDGTADWDALGADQKTIETQKAQCNTSRQACADALRRLEAARVITLGAAPLPAPPRAR